MKSGFAKTRQTVRAVSTVYCDSLIDRIGMHERKARSQENLLEGKKPGKSSSLQSPICNCEQRAKIKKEKKKKKRRSRSLLPNISSRKEFVGIVSTVVNSLAGGSTFKTFKIKESHPYRVELTAARGRPVR